MEQLDASIAPPDRPYDPSYDPYRCGNPRCDGDHSKHEEKVCTICKIMPYCSDKCRIEDFQQHQKIFCRFKSSTLAMQHTCAVCDNKLDGSMEVCTTCYGIKYCSVACKSENAIEHRLFCDCYANLFPRPDENHRLHIFFPWNAVPHFVWLSNRKKALDNIVSPETSNTEQWSFAFVEASCGVPCRKVGALVTKDSCNKLPESFANRSVGFTGEPVSFLRGNLVIYAVNWPRGGDFEDNEPGDALPADVPKLLAYCRYRESPMGRVPLDEWVGGE